MKDSDWDDYAWQRQGTAYGDMAKDHNDAILGQGKYARDNTASTNTRTGTAQPRQPLTGEATLNRVCSRLDNTIKALIDVVSWKIWLVLGLLCAVPAVIITSQQDWQPLGIAIAGLFNLFLPWFAVHTVRLAILLAAGLLGYCLIYTYLLIKVALIIGVIFGGLWLLLQLAS